MTRWNDGRVAVGLIEVSLLGEATSGASEGSRRSGGMGVSGVAAKLLVEYLVTVGVCDSELHCCTGLYAKESSQCQSQSFANPKQTAGRRALRPR